MDIFESWLLDFNKSMKLKGREVLLIIDNESTGHNITNELKKKLTNVTVEFFTPNTSSVIKPSCNQEIIRTFKAKYPNNLVKHCVKMIDLRDELVMSDIKQAIFFIKEAKLSVKRETIVNCWRKAGDLLFLLYGMHLIVT